MAEILATLDEVAAEMQVTPRWLRKVVKDHAVPVLRKGRIIRFDDKALDCLRQALRSRPLTESEAALERALRLTEVDGRSASDRGDVYFIACGASQVKIGTAVDPVARMATLQIGSPLPLRLIGSISGGGALEKRLHRRFVEYRVRGEWYEVAGRFAAFLNKNFPNG